MRLTGRLFDGDGAPVPDGMIELWDAEAAAAGAERGTDEDGRFSFVIAKPAAAARRGAAPRRLGLRPRPAPASADTRLLPRRGGGERRRSGPVGARRGGPRRLVAEADGDGVRFDIHLQAPSRRSSSLVSPFSAIFVPEQLARRVSRTTRGSRRCSTPSGALVNAQSAAGLVPTEAAAAVQQALRAGAYDVGRDRDGRPCAGKPGRAARAGDPHPGWGGERTLRASRRDQPGHPRHGRDARRASARIRLVDVELVAAADLCARLADEHREHGDGGSDVVAAGRRRRPSGTRRRRGSSGCIARTQLQ